MPAPPKRIYADIFTLNKAGQKEKNLAKELVTQGLAEALSYDPQNLQRSNYWHEYLEAHTASKEGVKGYYHPKFKEEVFMDLSLTRGTEAGVAQNQRRAMWDQYGPDGSKQLGVEKSRLIPATVEYVFGGHKVKVIIDMKNIGTDLHQRTKCTKLAVAIFLERIECKRGPMGDRSKWTDLDDLNERTGNQAKAFVEERINQQEVRVRINAKDSKHNFLGEIIFRTSKGSWKNNVGRMLLEEGLATLRQRNRDRPDLKTKREGLIELENKAREEKKGYWAFTEVKVPTESKQQFQEAQEVQKPPPKDDQEVYVTHVLDGANFYARVMPNPKHDRVEKALEGYPQAAPKKKSPWSPEKPEFKRRDVVAGKYGNGYYRCRVDRQMKQDGKSLPKYVVKFIDYGNDATLAFKDMEYLQDDLKTQKVYPLASKYTLAFLSPPPRESHNDTYYDAGTMLNNLILEQQFKIKNVSIGRENDGLSVDLLDKDQSINQKMVSRGLCRISSTVRKLHQQNRLQQAAAKYMRSLADQESNAKRNRLGMFRHGDVDADSDRDD